MLAGGLLAVIPVKCNSIFDKSSSRSADDEYEYVNVLGSGIPQRVKKGQAAVSASPVEVYGGAVVRDIAQKTKQLGTLPGAGR